MISYCCGFIFSMDYEKLLLIKKNKPVWQNGKLNGIGGKQESGETTHDSMVRECKEECDLTINKWDFLASIRNYQADYIVDFFISCYPDLDDVKQLTKEKLVVINPNKLPKNLIPNLNWLIPFALDKNITKPIIFVDTGKY